MRPLLKLEKSLLLWADQHLSIQAVQVRWNCGADMLSRGGVVLGEQRLYL